MEEKCNSSGDKAVCGVNNERLRVHFVMPPAKKPVDREYGCNYAFFMQHNVVILEIATLLRDNGFKVEITDCPVDKVPLREINPAEVYVFYSVYLTKDIDLKAAEYLDTQSQHIIFIGPDPTWSPKKYLLKENWFVVRGEPDFSLLDLLKNIKKQRDIKNVSYITKDKKVVNNPSRELTDLNKLPIPDRTLLKNPYKYTNSQLHNYPVTTMQTSRGCAYRCYYCVPNSLSYARELDWKKTHQRKPPVGLYPVKRILEEFAEINKLGYKGIKIIDDQLLWNKERSLEIFRGIKDFGLEIACLARADHLLDREVIEAMAEAGVKYVDIGIESFNQEILDYIQKDVKVETFYKAIKNLRDFGIEPEINVLIASCPLETKETIKETLEKTKQLDVEVIHVKACAPFPGTEFHKLAIKNKWITTDDYIAHDASKETYTNYPHLPQEYIEKVVKRTYNKHYFSPKFLFGELMKVRSAKELRDKAKTAYTILKR
ncbi:MAG: radical SAM protein [Candidatus Woesearchaeota archaeon]